jgi:hypothetical protein
MELITAAEGFLVQTLEAIILMETPAENAEEK